MNFRVSSDAETLSLSPQLNMQIGAKRARTCAQRVHVPTELPFCIPPLVVGHAVQAYYTTIVPVRQTAALPLLPRTFIIYEHHQPPLHTIRFPKFSGEALRSSAPLHHIMEMTFQARLAEGGGGRVETTMGRQNAAPSKQCCSKNVPRISKTLIMSF